MGNRKFLQTHYLFVFNESAAMAVQKLRINWLLSENGTRLRGTDELVVLSPQGTVLTTIVGGTPSGTRLELEIPADFHDFQKQL